MPIRSKIRRDAAEDFGLRKANSGVRKPSLSFWTGSPTRSEDHSVTEEQKREAQLTELVDATIGTAAVLYYQPTKGGDNWPTERKGCKGWDENLRCSTKEKIGRRHLFLVMNLLSRFRLIFPTSPMSLISAFNLHATSSFYTSAR